MTAMPPPEQWDDARLNAAFTARALRAPSAPPDVADEVVARLRPIDRRPQRRPWFVAAAAVIALVVALGGSSLLDQLRNGLSGPRASGSGEPSQSSSPTNPVLAALGGPITVSAALTVLDSEEPGRELAVTGYLAVPAFDPGCAVIPELTPNPTLLLCSDATQWLMEQPEQLDEVDGSIVVRGSPSGPAVQPAFAVVEPPSVPLPDDASAPIRVVLVGHFHDRRAALCERGRREGCARTFLVDQVASVGASDRQVTTRRLTLARPLDFEADVDALVQAVAPEAVVLSRQLMPVQEAFADEPILSDDPLVPYVDQSKLLWLVTAVDLSGSIPVPRTFALLDGSNWFAEITADGSTPLERAAPAPSSGPRPLPPSADPAAFATAPRTVVGIPVHGVAEVSRLRRLGGASGHDEWAIAGWYLAPRPGATCDAPASVEGTLSPPCDEMRSWLFHDPRQFGVEPGQLRSDPEEFPSVFNPLLPSDVPFEVGDTWSADQPTPAPVILIGHFGDSRVQAFHAGSYFVIDAVAWTRDGSTPDLDRIDRQTDAATEDPATVLARVEAVMANAALATWVTVVAAADFYLADPQAASEIEEFTAGPPVWIIRRLVASERAVNTGVELEYGYTTDHGSRVWSDTTDSPLDLATTIVLHDLDSRTRTIRVFDYARVVDSIAPLGDVRGLEWHKVGDNRIPAAVARGRSLREVAIRWSGGSCGRSWRLDVRGGNGSVDIEPYGSTCNGDNVERYLLITFRNPIDLDRVRVGSSCCG